MPAIGYVTRQSDDSYKGQLKTLTIRATIEIIPNRRKSSDTQPDYRVLADGVELGAGWVRIGEMSGRDYVSLSLSGGLRMTRPFGNAATGTSACLPPCYGNAARSRVWPSSRWGWTPFSGRSPASAGTRRNHCPSGRRAPGPSSRRRSMIVSASTWRTSNGLRARCWIGGAGKRRRGCAKSPLRRCSQHCRASIGLEGASGRWRSASTSCWTISRARGAFAELPDRISCPACERMAVSSWCIPTDLPRPSPTWRATGLRGS